jgi:hypothetical protein
VSWREWERQQARQCRHPMQKQNVIFHALDKQEWEDSSPFLNRGMETAPRDQLYGISEDRER